MSRICNQVFQNLQRHALGRTILSAVSTRLVRSFTKRPVNVFIKNGFWFRFDEGVYIPLGSQFKHMRSRAQRWLPRGEDVFAMRRDWWFRYSKPQAGDTIVDIGAGCGEDVWVFSEAVGNSGNVIAIEAQPRTFQILKTVLEINEMTNVVAHQLAASDSTGTCRMSNADDENWQLSSIITNTASDVLVTMGKLDDVPEIRSAKNIALLKMNIEGAEVVALRGASEILAKTQAVCICCHDFLGEETQTKAQVAELLAQAGFRLTAGPSDGEPYERDFIYGNR